jgi:hypothetical protein
VADQQQNDDSNLLTDIELERLKLYQDSFKHMTTFSSGGILLASAVTGALFPKPDLPWVLAISIFLLAIGALFAMVSLVQVARNMDSATGDSTATTALSLRVLLWWSVGAAYFGLALFAMFASANIMI